MNKIFVLNLIILGLFSQTYNMQRLLPSIRSSATLSNLHKINFRKFSTKKITPEKAYKIFGINNMSSNYVETDLKKIYLELARLYHPDKNSEFTERASRKMQEISSAFESIKEHQGFIKKNNIYEKFNYIDQVEFREIFRNIDKKYKSWTNNEEEVEVEEEQSIEQEYQKFKQEYEQREKQQGEPEYTKRTMSWLLTFVPMTICCSYGLYHIFDLVRQNNSNNENINLNNVSSNPIIDKPISLDQKVYTAIKLNDLEELKLILFDPNCDLNKVAYNFNNINNEQAGLLFLEALDQRASNLINNHQIHKSKPKSMIEELTSVQQNLTNESNIRSNLYSENFYKDNRKAIKDLILQGSFNIQYSGIEGYYILDRAIKFNDYELVALLIKKKAVLKNSILSTDNVIMLKLLKKHNYLFLDLVKSENILWHLIGYKIGVNFLEELGQDLKEKFEKERYNPWCFLLSSLRVDDPLEQAKIQFFFNKFGCLLKDVKDCGNPKANQFIKVLQERYQDEHPKH